MKTMKYFLSMAALALVGAMMTGCSSDEDFSNPQQPENKSNLVTLTTTVNLGDDATRALTSTGVKTFAAGETMAIYYWKNKGTVHEKAVSAPLTAGDITNGGKSATFTFTLDNPYKDMSVSYVYPAAMANADFTPNYDALYNNQDGTLATLASDFDFCTGAGAWSGDNLPSVTLVNQLAILAITLKNADGSSDITNTITGLTLSDGTNSYAVTRSAAEGPIYVAIRPTSSATIYVTATDGTNEYVKTLTTKTYEAGNGYPVSWRMAPPTNLSSISGAHTAINGETLTGTLEANVQISIAAGATVTLNNVNINGTGTWTSGNYAGITCVGNATIILSGTNTVKGFYEDYPGIYVPVGSTVTIKGSGSLTAYGGGYGVGIGGGYKIACGNIEIQGGTVEARGGNQAAGIGSGNQANCGNITISGGTVTATGGNNGAAGIGSGSQAGCGDITITTGVTKVTATKGSGAPNSIGAGIVGTCGTVTIGGVETGNITTSPYTYQP